MRTLLFYTFGAFATCSRIIRNTNIPSCANCVYYKPTTFNNEFASNYNKCEKFGEKNIITNKIKYDYADLCRLDEDKCGPKGIYFEEEKNIKWKIFKHIITRPLILTAIWVVFIIVITISY